MNVIGKLIEIVLQGKNEKNLIWMGSGDYGWMWIGVCDMDECIAKWLAICTQKPKVPCSSLHASYK